MSFTNSHAKTILFDSEYGNNGDILLKIQQAVNEASDGDVIVFNSDSYDLNDLNGLKIITISKSITFQGKTPIGFDEQQIGASGIQTTLNNVPTIAIRSDDVKFINISLVRKNQGESVFDILIDARHSTYLESNPISVNQLNYKGLEFNNVILDGAAYTFHSGNGVGIEMNNLSLINYRRTGYWANRFGRSNSTPRALFKHCLINPDSNIIGFDDRAVSFDAGNSEYPVIWDMNNTTFDTCIINDSGIAISRCENLTIDNSIFNDRVGAVDLVHIEEFSNNITVKNNTFNCQVPNINLRTRICQLDRDLQPVEDIEFTNNKIIGSYNFFISAYASSNITIVGNDFTDADAIGNNSIDFAFYESRDREPIPAEILSNDINVTNNPGLGLVKNKSIRVQLPINNAQFSINGYNSLQQDIKRLSPAPPVIANGIYEIVNKANGEKLISSDDGSGILTSNDSNENTQWKITFSPPYSYFIQNVGNNRYMETHVGYTEFDVITNQPQNVLPFLINYSSGSTLPFWSIVKAGEDFEIFPGGNERQGVFSIDGSSTKLIFAIAIDSNGVRSNLTLGDEVKWEFQPVSTTTEAPIGSIITLKKSGGDKRFISSVVELNQDLYANQSEIFGDRQKFKIEEHPSGTGIALRSLASNKFVRIIGNDSNAIVDALGGNGSWTKFEWKPLGNNKVGLKSLSTNKWLQAPHNVDLTPLNARGEAAGLWETFNWEIVSNNKSVNFRKEKNITVHPNIINTGDAITITSDTKNNNTIEVFNLDGKLIKKEVSNSIITVMSIDNITSGVYLIVINGNKAHKLIVK
ncbi:hypothetical protein AWE51_08295 [Aquimarina aggregata]|uniref:Secretion system C-terminal sorting domain-containing protein n=1 Tax=Aquimarina aggregata TaxID=1642818 RepID=A0A162Z9C3_9FLAO|nr:hypothetical protein AWE51_08295 [Aquimarina aggregata]